MNIPRIILKPDKEQSIYRRHPWVFSGAIKKVPRSVEEGDIVAVYNTKQEFMALGHFQEGSIAVRIFSFEEVEIDQNFWEDKIERAWEYRWDTGLLDDGRTNVFRLVHGEGDGLPGLIIDYYDGTVVFQAHSVGMYYERDHICEALRTVLEGNLKVIYDKSEHTLPYKAEVEAKNGYVLGESGSDTVYENGLLFKIDYVEGQKTGFFVDQRESRSLLERHSKDRSVLNMFGYTGGFSVYAMRGGANEVVTVDLSEKAIELANENVTLNFPDDDRHKGIAADAFEYLKQQSQTFDVIVLDPPSFAKHPKVLNKALQGYKRLNQLGIEQVKSGGLVFTFSCSQAVSKEDFRKAIFAAAANAKRHVRIVHQIAQPADHPVSIFHPEGEYLKGFVLYVE